MSASLDVANHTRAVHGAARQVDAVREALRVLGPTAPTDLRAVGLLRLAHPDLTLRELGEMAGLSKDTVAGRLRRLELLAERPDSLRQVLTRLTPAEHGRATAEAERCGVSLAELLRQALALLLDVRGVGTEEGDGS